MRNVKRITAAAAAASIIMICPSYTQVYAASSQAQEMKKEINDLSPGWKNGTISMPTTQWMR